MKIKLASYLILFTYKLEKWIKELRFFLLDWITKRKPSESNEEYDYRKYETFNRVRKEQRTAGLVGSFEGLDNVSELDEENYLAELNQYVQNNF